MVLLHHRSLDPNSGSRRADRVGEGLRQWPGCSTTTYTDKNWSYLVVMSKQAPMGGEHVRATSAMERGRTTTRALDTDTTARYVRGGM